MMLKSLAIILLICVSLTLSSCSLGIVSLKNYLDNDNGYEFLYPSGWIQVAVKNASEGVDVVFRDLIEQTENLSVIISDIPANKTLSDLGTPTDVGYRFLKQINNTPSLNRQAELIDAQIHESDKKTYYILEYQVKLPNNQERHDLASVTVSHGKLYTLNLSTPQKRWNKVKNAFKTAANSFTVY